MKQHNIDALKNLIDGNNWDTVHVRHIVKSIGDKYQYPYTNFDALNILRLFAKSDGYVKAGGENSDLVKELVATSNYLYELLNSIYYDSRLYNEFTSKEESQS